MATLEELQVRGTELFARLFEAETGDAVRPGPGNRRFSWFHPPDALDATSMALRFSALADSADSLEDGLEAVLDAAGGEDPARGLVRQALSIFVTHNVRGRHLIKPRTVTSAPELFSPSPKGPDGFSISEGGPSPQLDYWREDPLANEHHEHWHQVYPFTGVPVRDFRRWATETPIAVMDQILRAWDPSRDWLTALEAASVEMIADFFQQFVATGQLQLLHPVLQRQFLEANDRHGELFVYMHAQMLARYDAELAAHGLDPVEPWGPDNWAQPIPVGHNPIEVAGFGRRPPNMSLPPQWVAMLQGLQAPIDQATTSGVAVRADGSTVALDANLIGEAIEAAAAWTTELDNDTDTGTYQGMHNTGHGILGALAGNNSGVMNNPVVAIRDPIFWRWHKHIDNLAQDWLDTRPPDDFSGGPDVTLRNAVGEASGTTTWASPDIILVDPAALPADADAEAAGVDSFGGDAWDTAAGAASGPAADAVIDELTTRMEVWNSPEGDVNFLTHDPFAYYLRVENPSDDPVDVTVRIFLAPSDAADQRRRWIEMDKFRTTLAAGRNVLHRPDTESAVIKRPAETTPENVGSGASADESGYCDCGWPYTLLLPRGTEPGKEYRLVVMCTRWEDDQVADPDHCGSMSFCGALDRYPDQREMGYPFARTFADPIDQTFAGLPNAAGRTLTIRHIG